jgi:hypothetical protein
MKLYKHEIKDVYDSVKAYRTHLVIQLDNLERMKSVPLDVLNAYDIKMSHLSDIMKRIEEWKKP